MNGVRSYTTLLLVVILNGCVLLASSSPDTDSTLNDLYENLLQREYTGPISFPNHQVERKAQRSPSLRLRFGRRSDPSMALLGNQFSRFSEEVNKKPIRSPSLRLRFGKRDPSMYSDDYFINDLDNVHRETRDPAPRLRWGRRNDPNMPMIIDQALSEYDTQPEKRKSVRLRFGRSYKPAVEDQQSGTDGTGDLDLTDDSAVASGNLNRLGF